MYPLCPYGTWWQACQEVMSTVNRVSFWWCVSACSRDRNAKSPQPARACHSCSPRDKLPLAFLPPPPPPPQPPHRGCRILIELDRDLSRWQPLRADVLGEGEGSLLGRGQTMASLVRRFREAPPQPRWKRSGCMAPGAVPFNGELLVPGLTFAPMICSRHNFGA